MEIVGRTLSGLEHVLSREITALGGEQVIPGKRAVTFQGDLEILYKANLFCRTAISFLIPVNSFKAKNKEALYTKLHNLPWSDYLEIDQTFMVKPIVKSRFFKHSKYAALIAKDAIVDYFRKKTQKRPNISTKDPQVVFVLKIYEDNVVISLDSSGLSLNRRGYRVRQGPAPINEVLAAGLILLSDWDPSAIDFLDPMCGGGTIAIEAALMAAKIPPQAMRRTFAFQNWKNYDSKLWNQVRVNWEEERPQIKIIARDADQKAIDLARFHAEEAELSDYINFECVPFEQTASASPVHIIMNPPYDERIGREDILQLYATIGSTLKHNFPGSEAWILSANRQALHKIGLRPSKKLNLYNGQLECKYQKYELFKGKRAVRQKNN